MVNAMLHAEPAGLDTLDRQLINTLQEGFPISEYPFADVASELGVDEAEIITRVDRLLATGFLSRFGPMYNAEKMGGALSLAAMQIPETDFDRVAVQVNSFSEVAHNYARDHQFNMWFVLATEHPGRIDEVTREIEQSTGYQVFNMPKLTEFYVGLYFKV